MPMGYKYVWRRIRVADGRHVVFDGIGDGDAGYEWFADFREAKGCKQELGSTIS